MGKTVAEPIGKDELDYHALNALLNLYDDDGKIQFSKDREAARQYFLQHVNQNTVFFHNLKEKLDYLVENKYYDPIVLDKYQFEDVKALFKRAYAHKFRFQSFLGAYKYYTSYTLKTFDGPHGAGIVFSVQFHGPCRLPAADIRVQAHRVRRH